MKKSTRTLAALLLLGAMSNIAACGDDDDDDATPGAGDGSTPAPNPDAGMNPLIDAAQPAPADGSTPSNPMPTPTLTACPAPTMDVGMACLLTAPASNPLKQDLTLAPVQGKLGYALMGGVFIGEDVGGEAQPAAGKARVTLTVRPGTTILGSDALSFLLIQRGSKIVAEGTADSPIVFTSAQATKAPGQWGGLILNGRAPTNQGSNVMGEAETGFYGGPDEADNSGVLKYVRLEFTGGKVNATNELNGVAFQGVGNGTVVDFVHVHASDDDAFEFFGGTVNAKHLVATATGDDGLDWVMGYRGKIQYAVVQQWMRVSSNDPNGIEADNWQDAPSAAPVSNPVLSNLTVVGGAAVPNAKGAILRRGTQGKLHNALFIGWNAACLHVDGAESGGFAGNQLAMQNSRIACTKNYFGTMAPVAEQVMFEAAGANNQTIAAGTALLTDATSATAPNFAPVAGSPLLAGGAAPAGDAFFTAEPFIGALGASSWISGSWMKITPF